MKYVKAGTVFPDKLLKEIQKYVQGELVYIPNPNGIRKKWGERSGSRESLKHRNKIIYDSFKSGTSIDKLSDEFYLSLDSIKKIVYKKAEA